MDNSDVTITAPSVCKDSFTKITAESLTMMDSFDVTITLTNACKAGVTYITLMSVLDFHFNTLYRVLHLTKKITLITRLFFHLIYVKVQLM